MMQKPAVSSPTTKPPVPEGEQGPQIEIPPEEIGDEYEVPAFLRLGRQQ